MLTCALLWRQAEHAARLGVLKQPQSAVRSYLDVADAVTHIPALGRRRAALAVEGNPHQRLGRQARYKAEPFHCGNMVPCRT